MASEKIHEVSEDALAGTVRLLEDVSSVALRDQRASDLIGEPHSPMYPADDPISCAGRS